jgi:hypothetical protein
MTCDTLTASEGCNICLSPEKEFDWYMGIPDSHLLGQEMRKGEF